MNNPKPIPLTARPADSPPGSARPNRSADSDRSAGSNGGLPAETPARRCRFPKRRRIASGDDFTAIIGNGSFAADDTLIVNALPASSLRRRKPNSAEVPRVGEIGPQEIGRLGVTIPRKTGNAVVRNRWKRLIREAYRRLQHELPAGFDFVVRPRRGAVAEFSRVHRSLRRLAVRAASTPPGAPSSKRRPAKHG